MAFITHSSLSSILIGSHVEEDTLVLVHWFNTQLKISHQISKMHVIGTPIICQRSGFGELRQQCCFCVFFWQDDQKLCKHPHNADGSAVMGGERFFC